MTSSSRSGSVEVTSFGNPLRSRLGRRLLAWFLLFSLGPLLGSNMVGYLESLGIIESHIERQLQAIAEIEARHVRDQVDRSMLELQAIAAGNEFLVAGALRGSGGEPHPMGEVADREAVEIHLRSKLRELRELDILFLQDLDTTVIATTGPVPPGSRLASSDGTVKPRFETLRPTGGPEAAGPAPLFRLSVPVRSASGRLTGHLVGVMSQENLTELVEIPEHVAGTIESFIVDREGRPLFVSHPHGEIDFANPLASPLLEGHPGVFARYGDREGVEVIGTSVDVDGLPWQFVAEFPVDEALAPLQNLRRLSLIFAAVFGVFLVVTAWFVAGGIVAPVRRLLRATRRVASGDLDVEVEVEEENEVGELGRAFNEMTEELARASDRVEQLHRREIERASQLATVGELASGVAHEIKNPVVGISNGLDLVRRRIGELPELEPIMEEMSTQLERIEGAVRDLLAFARPQEPNLAPVDPGEIVERAGRLVQPAADSAEVQLELQYGTSGEPLSADAELLRQALVNLMMNAVQATPEGGRVTVTSGTEGDQAVFRVSDTGRGIHPGELNDVFKPFYTTRHNGTGLGLPITREIVKRHGGKIDVQSRLGKGTTFSLTLPLSPSGKDRGAGDEGEDFQLGHGLADVGPETPGNDGA